MMHDNDVRHLLVTDHQGRLVGILSDRDVLPSRGEGVVSELMTEEVLFVRPDTRAVEASALMLDRKFGALPVVDEAGRPVGVVTETDFVRACHVLLGGDSMG